MQKMHKNLIRLPGFHDRQGLDYALAPLLRHSTSTVGVIHHCREDRWIEAVTAQTDAVTGQFWLDGFDGFRPLDFEQFFKAAYAPINPLLKAGLEVGNLAADGMDKQVQGGIAAVAEQLSAFRNSLQQLVDMVFQSLSVLFRQVQMHEQGAAGLRQGRLSIYRTLPLLQQIADVMLEPRQMVLEDPSPVIPGGKCLSRLLQPLCQWAGEFFGGLIRLFEIRRKKEQGIVVTQSRTVPEWVE